MIGGLVLGLVGVVDSLGATFLANRHQRLTRWDDERALAVGELVEAAARSEGSSFRRGRSRAREEPPELSGERRQRCEGDLDTLLANGARLRAVVRSLTPEVEAMLEAEREVRRRADERLARHPRGGLDRDTDTYRRSIDHLAAVAADALDTAEPAGAIGPGRRVS